MPIYTVLLTCNDRRLCTTNISHLPNFASASMSIDGNGAFIRRFDRMTGIVEIQTLDLNYYFTLYVVFEDPKTKEEKKKVNALLPEEITQVDEGDF